MLPHLFAPHIRNPGVLPRITNGVILARSGGVAKPSASAGKGTVIETEFVKTPRFGRIFAYEITPGRFFERLDSVVRLMT